MAGIAEDYVDVGTRIAEFRKMWPDGTLTRIAPDGSLVPVEYREFGGKQWIVYTAFAYRTPEDTQPAVGTAWEQVPGPTNFTRDSELQNAETAAWGRAMVAALAVDSRKGVASADEVRARQIGVQKDAAPDGWATRVEGAGKQTELDAIYHEARANGWANEGVLKALTARKEALNGGTKPANPATSK